jgi:hypothetical protein
MRPQSDLFPGGDIERRESEDEPELLDEEMILATMILLSLESKIVLLKMTTQEYVASNLHRHYSEL